jgi:hypothetical protein
LQPGQKIAQLPTKSAPQLDSNLAEKARAAMDKARKLLGSAASMPAPQLTTEATIDTQISAVIRANGEFQIGYAQLLDDVENDRYQAVLDALPGLVVLAQKVLGIPQTATAPTQQPAQQPKLPVQQQAPQTDPAQLKLAKASMEQARATLQKAAGIPTSTPALTLAKSDFQSQYTKLLNHGKDGNASAVLVTLPRVVGLARKVLALSDAAQVPAKQLAHQKAQFDEMQGVCDAVVRTYFNPAASASFSPYSAASIAGKAPEDMVSDQKAKSGKFDYFDLKPGKYFDAYLKALDGVEKAKQQLPNGTPIPQNNAQTITQCCKNLLAAGQDCLDNLEGDKKDRENATRKLQIVSEGMKAARHLAAAMELAMIGEPTVQKPWDRQTELRAGGLQAAISFETGYKKGSSLKESGEAGLSDAFWVESIPSDGTKVKKNFIFKPVRGERVSGDNKKGSGAAKEALASANGKLFEQQTGIDLGIPDTYVTTIGAYALDLKGGDADGQPRIGSLQAFAPAGGKLGEAPRDTMRQIPPKQCQKIAIQDIIGLNLDRHSGNLLLNTPQGGAPELVPIDHGDTLPTRQDFKSKAQRFGGLSFTTSGTVTVQNAVLGIPGAYENFDQDTIAKLDLLDPDAMVQGMKDHLAALDAVNPGLDAQQKVAGESLQMSKRSMMFMKAAARELSPAEIQIALGQHSDALFDAQDVDFDDVVDQVIAEMKSRKAAYMEIFTTSGQRRDDMFKRLQNNGWTPATGDLGNWVMKDPNAALMLYKSNARHPSLQPKGDGSQLKATTQQVGTATQGLDSNKVTRQSVTELVERGNSHLDSADDADKMRLLPIQKQIYLLMGDGESAQAEKMARDFEEQALHAGLKELRKQGDALYAERDKVFSGMGTDEEEMKKRAKADKDTAQKIYLQVHRRTNVDTYYKNLQAMTSIGADIAEARNALQQLRKVLTAAKS